MRCEKHGPRMGQTRNTPFFLLENMKGREQVEDLDVDGDSSKFDMKKG